MTEYESCLEVMKLAGFSPACQLSINAQSVIWVSLIKYGMPQVQVL